MRNAAIATTESAPEPSFKGPTAALPAQALRHRAATIALHWGSMALLLIATGTVLVRELIEHSGVRSILLDLHRDFGLLVLLALAARLFVRLMQGLTPTDGAMSRSARLAAQGVHVCLYGLLAVIPVLGWGLTSAHGVGLRLFGMASLPALVAADSDLADKLTDQHVLASWILLGLVSAHVLAALFHHFMQRDEVLSAMVPGLRALPARGARPRALSLVGRTQGTR
jgi:cytochrome b561